MKDEKDTNTSDIFPDTEAGEKEKIKFLKGKNQPFQRLHTEKIIKGGTVKTTVSIETLSYELLALKLETIPHTRKANETIKNWIDEEMRKGILSGLYDPEASYSFSVWLKKIITFEIVDPEIKTKWWRSIESGIIL